MNAPETDIALAKSEPEETSGGARDEQEMPGQEMAIQLAKRIQELGLEVPAILFLELHRPFASVVYNSALFAQPFLTPFFGLEKVNGFLEFLNRKDSIEFLVSAIETNRKKS